MKMRVSFKKWVLLDNFLWVLLENIIRIKREEMYV